MAGLPLPANEAQAVAPPAPAPMSMSVGGVAAVQSMASVQAQQQRANSLQVQAQQGQPHIVGLAAHIKSFFQRAQTERLQVEQRMLEAMYARRGEYMPAKLAEIEASGQPAIYMMLPSVKMRQAESLLRDVFMGTGNDKPFRIKPTPSPELPPFEVNQIMQGVTAEVEQALLMGLEPTIEDVRQRLMAAKDQLVARLAEAAREKAARMELKMEDQLVEGGFRQALDQFITDLTTFPTAFVAGPLVRKKPKMAWGPDGQLVVIEKHVLEWERVSPFDIYPAPWAKHLQDGSPLVRLHKLTRTALNQMIGVEGYSEPAIRQVLEQYGDSGLHSLQSIDSQRALAEGKMTSEATQHNGLMDAYQFWGSVSGKMLRDWGMKPEQVPDVSKEYNVEAWLVGDIVIKAVLNADPLARRPIYGTSYEKIPGSVWGNGVYDLMRDCAGMCNAAARALAANLGISSGPQVAVNVDRVAPGEDITSQYPWKIWQTTSDPMGSTAKAIEFFQPTSNAAELMGVYDRFSVLADEYTGIPKYMTGTEGTPGAGRTASGLSMMIGNASKIVKQVVAGVDLDIITEGLERLYYYNMRYGEDPDLKGDVLIIAQGALSLQVKEAAQVRRNEFLINTANPFDMQIMGMEGRAEVLRAQAMALDLNADKIVPPVAVLRDRNRMQQMMMLQMAAQPGQGGGQEGGETLQNGQPTSDHFSPSPKPGA